MKYEVTFYYHTNCTVVVEAENKEEALTIAESKVCDDIYTDEILTNLTEDDDPDVVEA